jgi:hypothetical protein
VEVALDGPQNRGNEKRLPFLLIEGMATVAAASFSRRLGRDIEFDSSGWGRGDTADDIEAENDG